MSIRKIFISYRREDATTEATAIAAVLRQIVGDKRVFLDTSDINPGSSWPKEIKQRLAESSTVLVLIGRRWLKAQTPYGFRRLDQPDDWVRLEIENAFAAEKHIVPVLVDGADMPPEDALPESIKQLARLQYIDLGGRIDEDSIRLVVAAVGADTARDLGDLHRAPEFADVVARQSTIAKITEFIGALPVVSIVGLSGTGKTYLVADLVSVSEWKVLWYDAQANEPVDDLLTSLQTEIDLGAGSQPSRCKRLAHWLAENGVTLVIDDFHCADRQTYEPLLRAVSGMAGELRIILIGQRHVEITNLGADVPNFEIGGLTKSELEEFLQTRGVRVSNEIIARLRKISGGLPFAAGLFSTLVGHFGIDPRDLLEGDLLVEDRLTKWCEKVLGLVQEDDRDLLTRLSISDAPFNRSTAAALSKLAGVHDPIASLGRLRRTYLLQSYTRFRWRVHPILAAYSKSSMSKGEHFATRIALAKHLIRGLSRRRNRIYDYEELLWKTRACRHFARAEAFDQAIDLVHDVTATAKAHGYYALFLDVVSLVPEDERKKSPWLQYHIAHCLQITGKFGLSLEACKNVDSGGDATLTLATSRLHAETLGEVGSVSAALDEISEAIAKNGASAKKTVARHAESTFVALAIRAGKLSEAEQSASKLLATANKEKDERGAAIALTHLGAIRRHSGDLDRARQMLTSASDLFAQIPDNRGIVWSCGELALVMATMSPATATEYLRVAVTKASEIGIAGRDYEELLETFSATRIPNDFEDLVSAEAERIANLRV